MTRIRTTTTRARRLLLGGAATVLVLPLVGGVVDAHDPDPFFSGGPFAQNQDLRFRWRAGAEPTASIKAAITAAAADANASRGSKAATFTYDPGGANPIGYGLGATCGVNGLACFTRTAPIGFTMWLREQGHVFDWGTLKWCQAYATAPNGCYDAETIALDEFGHVEGLGHHVNFADDSDYMDAVVQTYSRTKPATGWNVHTLRRCDVAALQLEYDMVSTTAKYSTCLDLVTVLSLFASPSFIDVAGTTTLTASLKVADYDSYDELGGNQVSGRVVTLQRRASGATTWVTVGAMPARTAAARTPSPRDRPPTWSIGRCSRRSPGKGSKGARRPWSVFRSTPARSPSQPRSGSTSPVSDEEGAFACRSGPACGRSWRSWRSRSPGAGAARAPSGSASPTGRRSRRCQHHCPPTATPTAIPPASAPPPSTTPSIPAQPPDASLSAEGGDPVVGQLGSYIWADGGSDSPWLPGSPIRVGTGEPLTVSLAAGAAIDEWAARRVRAGTSNGTGAVALGSGGPPATFAAPAPGTWSVQVVIRFAGGLGSATYYWQVDVR